MPAVILANDTNCPTVTATPDSASVPAPGKVVTLTFNNALAPPAPAASPGSVKPKSAAAKVYTASSSTVTVLLVPTGASLTAVTLTVIVRAEVSRSTPLFAVPPSSCTWKVKLA